MTVGAARRRLAVIWFAGAGALFLILFLQSVFGVYGDRLDEAWRWFLPNVLPTLTLMISVFVAEVRSGESSARETDRFFYRLALTLSAAYLAVVALTLILSRVSAYPPLELLSLSNLWLGPLQGVAGGALGTFFVRGGGSGPSS